MQSLVDLVRAVARSMALAGLALAAAWPLAGAAQGDGGGVEALASAYARWPDVERIVLSPSNDHAALQLRLGNGRIGLATLDLTKPQDKPKVLAAFDDVDIGAVQWLNDRRLVYEIRPVWEYRDYDKWGAYAVDLDGADPRHLISARSDTEVTGSAFRARALPRIWRLWRPVGAGDDRVLVARAADTFELGWRATGLAVLNTRTQELQPLTEHQPEGADGWWFDRQQVLRVVTATHRDRRQLWWRPAADAAWEKLEDDDAFGGSFVQPVALEHDGTLVVRARRDRDTEALHVYDLKRRRLEPEPLVGVSGHDIGPVRFDGGVGRVVGVDVRTATPMTVWFDEGPAAVQAAVDKALPSGRSNALLCGRCVGAKRVLVWSESDRQPGEFWLYDTGAAKLTLLGEARPWMKEAAQARRSVHRVAARDGLMLPVVVTHPRAAAGEAPAPTIVLVHGGPWAPGADATWSAEPQFLAARGYRVLEVSFRGTTGLGWKHERASWGQWGLTMQDDLEDALLWAVGQKLTDPGRVCIYGGSYGGYAALMGPVRHPQRYRCAVSHVGVTDIGLLYSGNWTDMHRMFRSYGLTRLVGDPQADAERLRRTSPLHRVADIRVPILVVQGRSDRRVEPVHADRFVAAARAAGVDVERVDYEDGHGWYSSASHEDFLKRLDAFFARHLAPR